MDILYKILADKKNRKQLIAEFQDKIWNDKIPNSILSELAYDLDFYEPKEELRNKNISLYGDDRLEEEIKAALNKLKNNSSE